MKRDESQEKLQKSNPKKIIVIQSQNDQFEIQVNSGMTTWDLFQTVKQHPLTKFSNNLIAIKSKNNRVTLDYILSLCQHEAQIPLSKLRDREILVCVYAKREPYRDKLSLNDFTFEQCIGKGGTSDVFLVRHNISGRLFALKMIKKQYISDCRRLEQVLRERKILSEILNNSKYLNEFIVQLHASFASKDHLSFLMEFSPGGELFYHLQNQRFREDQVKHYFCEVLCALEELHRSAVLYRDLKPENILIDLNGHMCLTDFGLSKVGLMAQEVTHSFCGSPEYMPPEIVQRDGYSYAADFYTLGCLLYELMVGLPPHYSQNTQEILTNIQYKDIEYPTEISMECLQVLQALLSKDQHKRIQSFDQLKRLKWFSSIDWTGIKLKKLKAPINIDLYLNNIHDEFLQLDMNEMNESVRQGHMNCSEDLFNFFYYVNPNSQILFKERFQFVNSQPKIRVSSDHSNLKSQSQLKNKQGLNINVDQFIETSINQFTKNKEQFPLRVQTASNILLKSNLIAPLSLLRKSFQNNPAKQKSTSRLDESNKSKSKEKQYMSERGYFDKFKALENLLQNPLCDSQDSRIKQETKIKSTKKTSINTKIASSTQSSKNPLKLNLELMLQQQYKHIYSSATPNSNSSKNFRGIKQHTYSQHYNS